MKKMILHTSFGLLRFVLNRSTIHIYNFLAVALALILGSVQMQAQVTAEWVRNYEGNFKATPFDMTMDSLGNVYIAGSTSPVVISTGNDYATVKYNSSGALQWEAFYNGTANSLDIASAIAVDPQGNVYVTGSSPGIISGHTSGSDYATIKYDAGGNELWVRRYNGNSTFFNNVADNAADIAVDDLGNVYVTGRSYSDDGETVNCLTIKYDGGGSQLWAARNTQSSMGVAVKVDALGNVYVSGWGSGTAGGIDYITIKYNSSGQELWLRRFNESGIYNGLPTAMVLDDDGNVYVTGSDSDGFLTVKYNSAGDLMWSHDSIELNNGVAEDIVVDAQGNVYVTGYNMNLAYTTTEYATVKYNSDGVEQWVSKYAGLGGETFESGAESIAIDDLGNVYVTGHCEGEDYLGGDYHDYATIKYNNAGIEQWAIRYDEPNESSRAIAIIVDAEGNVYVTGTTDIGGSVTVTIKYNQSTTSTTLTANATAGSLVLDVASANGFDIGDDIMINPGGVNEEINSITGFGSFILESPLINDHQAGEAILNLTPTSVEEIITDFIPEEFILEQNYPNPFNPSTKIRFAIPNVTLSPDKNGINSVEGSRVQLNIYDILGNEVATLVDEFLPSGSYEAEWNAVNVTSGVYFYSIKAGEYLETKKMVLLR